MSLKKAYFLIFIILLIDQISKIYIKTHFMPTESVPVFGDWFVLEYVENQGMAFGTTFGNQMWHKLALSIFRIIAIIGIGYYWFKQAKAGARKEFLIAVGLKQKKRSLRIISLSLFLITLIKLFVVDIRGISEGGKIAAFISLGLLLLIVSFMYQRLKKILLSDDSADQSDKKEEFI